jgi:hypothetical protein
MRIARTLSSILCAVALMASLGACAKKEEGPAEKAGKAVDDAMRESAQKMDEASHKMGDSMRDAGQKMGEAMEDAGKKMQEKSGH